jgi:hemolysin activation/secretion protein
LNNRYSANTVPLRLDIAARYTNLWQLGHTIGFGFQVAPQRPSDAIVYSGFYIAPVPGVDWLSVMLHGIRQNSDVSTLGGSAVAGNGVVLGGRLLFDLPGSPGFFQTASFGMDYKDFQQDLDFGTEVVESPITYYPFTASYTGVWFGEGYEVQLDAALVFSLRGLGSDEVEFDNRRYNSDGNFVYLRGTLAAKRDLPFGFQLYGLVQGQGCATPLVDSEQFALGGLTTVRGYLESEALGDSAVAGTVEIRSPSLLGWVKKPVANNEWRFFAFLDAGTTFINDPLPEQQEQFNLWSFGFGSTIKIAGGLNGSVVVGFPQVTQSPTVAGNPHVTFRLWGEL